MTSGRDEGLRELERKFRESDAAEDGAAWLKAMLRAGKFSEPQLQLAAQLGYEPAWLALEIERPFQTIRRFFDSVEEYEQTLLPLSVAAVLKEVSSLSSQEREECEGCTKHTFPLLDGIYKKAKAFYERPNSKRRHNLRTALVLLLAGQEEAGCNHHRRLISRVLAAHHSSDGDIATAIYHSCLARYVDDSNTITNSDLEMLGLVSSQLLTAARQAIMPYILEVEEE